MQTLSLYPESTLLTPWMTCIPLRAEGRGAGDTAQLFRVRAAPAEDPSLPSALVGQLTATCNPSSRASGDLRAPAHIWPM